MGVFEQLQKKQNKSTGGLFQQLVKPPEPSPNTPRGGLLGLADKTLGRFSKGFTDTYFPGVIDAQNKRMTDLGTTNPIVQRLSTEPQGFLEKGAGIAGTIAGYAAPSGLAYKAISKPAQLGYKALTKGRDLGTKGRIGLEASKGALAGGVISAGETARDEAFVPGRYTAKEHLVRGGINTLAGAALDPLIVVGGPKALGAIKKFFGKDKVKQSELAKALDDPTTPQEVKDEILMLPEGKTILRPRETPQPIKENFVSAKKNPNYYADRLEELRNVAMSQNLPPGREKEAMEEIWRNMSRYDESITLDELINRATPSLKQLNKRSSGNLKNPAEPNQFGVSKADQLGLNSRLKDNPINFTMLDKKPLEYVGRLAPMNKVKVQKGTSELIPKLAQRETTPLKAFNLTSKDTNIEYPFETGGLKPSLQASKEAAAGSLRSLEPKLKPLSANQKGLEPPPLKAPKIERTLNHYSAKQKELEKLIKDGADDKQINAARNQAKEIARSMDADQLAKDLYIKPPSMKVVDGKQTINADDFTPQRVQQAMDIALDNSNVNWAGATDQNILFGNFKTLHRLVNSMFKENTLKAEPKNLVKRIGIDSFNDSKREMHKHLEAIASDLKTNLQQFGITKNSKKSAIAMAHGEGKISLEEVQRQFPNDWQKIVEAKDYARKFYDDMIDMQNEVLRKIHANLKGDALDEKLIPKRKDYFRHMQEDIAKYRDVLDLIDSAAGIRNVDDVVKPLAKKGKDLGTRLKEKALGRPIKIDPELVGTSEYTNPRSKFNTTKLKRTTDETDFDLMGGMLDYSNQATYQMYVSPYIQVIDALEKGLVARTNGNMNKYIELFQGIKQVLQGKTLPFDRAIQKKLGREVMRTIDAVNTRVRKNSVLASASAMAAQYTHLPNAIAIGGVKNFTDGAKEYFKHVFKKGGLDPLKNSTFMKERYATNDLLRQFETGFINKATDKAGKISLEVMDKIAGEITWRTMYSKALKEGSKNAIRRSDDLTRDILGARGRGEKSLIMSERMTNMYMPFQLEVANNAMIMGELIKNRQGKEFLRLMTANYLFNGLVGYTVGRKFMFDPIKGMYDAYQLAQEEAETSQKIYKAAGRIAGEIASPLPGAGVWGSAILTPQFRKSFFGDVDPTRYGSEPLITGAINDPLFKFATPFGGAQLKRTLQGASSLAQGGNYGSDLSNLQRGAKTMLGGESADDGKKLRFPVERTPANTVRALVGGPWNTKEGREYLEKNRRPLSANQTQDLLKKADRGRDSASLYQSLMLDRELASIEKKIKEERKEGRTIDQIQKLLDRRLEIMSERRKLNSIK